MGTHRPHGRNSTPDVEVDYGEHSVRATGAKQTAAGVRAVMVSMQRSLTSMGHPETNALVPLDHVAAKSNTPVSNAVVIRLEPASRPAGAVSGDSWDA